MGRFSRGRGSPFIDGRPIASSRGRGHRGFQHGFQGAARSDNYDDKFSAYSNDYDNRFESKIEKSSYHNESSSKSMHYGSRKRSASPMHRDSRSPKRSSFSRHRRSRSRSRSGSRSRSRKQSRSRSRSRSYSSDSSPSSRYRKHYSKSHKSSKKSSKLKKETKAVDIPKQMAKNNAADDPPSLWGQYQLPAEQLNQQMSLYDHLNEPKIAKSVEMAWGKQAPTQQQQVQSNEMCWMGQPVAEPNIERRWPQQQQPVAEQKFERRWPQQQQPSPSSFQQSVPEQSSSSSNFIPGINDDDDGNQPSSIFHMNWGAGDPADSALKSSGIPGLDIPIEDEEEFLYGDKPSTPVTAEKPFTPPTRAAKPFTPPTRAANPPAPALKSILKNMSPAKPIDKDISGFMNPEGPSQYSNVPKQPLSQFKAPKLALGSAAELQNSVQNVLKLLNLNQNAASAEVKPSVPTNMPNPAFPSAAAISQYQQNMNYQMEPAPNEWEQATEQFLNSVGKSITKPQPQKPVGLQLKGMEKVVNLKKKKKDEKLALLKKKEEDRLAALKKKEEEKAALKKKEEEEARIAQKKKKEEQKAALKKKVQMKKKAELAAETKKFEDMIAAKRREMEVLNKQKENQIKQKVDHYKAECKRNLEMMNNELKLLRKQQGDIMRRSRRVKDGHKDSTLSANSSLQNEIMGHIFAITKDMNALDSGKMPAEFHFIKPKDSKKIKLGPHKYVDSEEHWCQSCNFFAFDIHTYLRHLHSPEHEKNIYSSELPWFEKYPDERYNKNLPEAPFQGSEFLLPAVGFYCQLCTKFVGDDFTTERHLKTPAHNEAFAKYVTTNIFYARRRDLDKSASRAIFLREEKKRQAKEKMEREAQRQMEINKMVSEAAMKAKHSIQAKVAQQAISKQNVSLNLRTQDDDDDKNVKPNNNKVLPQIGKLPSLKAKMSAAKTVPPSQNVVGPALPPDMIKKEDTVSDENVFRVPTAAPIKPTKGTTKQPAPKPKTKTCYPSQPAPKPLDPSKKSTVVKRDPSKPKTEGLQSVGSFLSHLLDVDKKHEKKKKIQKKVPDDENCDVVPMEMSDPEDSEEEEEVTNTRSVSIVDYSLDDGAEASDEPENKDELSEFYKEISESDASRRVVYEMEGDDNQQILGDQPRTEGLEEPNSIEEELEEGNNEAIDAENEQPPEDTNKEDNDAQEVEESNNKVDEVEEETKPNEGDADVTEQMDQEDNPLSANNIEENTVSASPKSATDENENSSQGGELQNSEINQEIAEVQSGSPDKTNDCHVSAEENAECPGADGENMQQMDNEIEDAVHSSSDKIVDSPQSDNLQMDEEFTTPELGSPADAIAAQPQNEDVSSHQEFQEDEEMQDLSSSNKADDHQPAAGDCEQSCDAETANEVEESNSVLTNTDNEQQPGLSAGEEMNDLCSEASEKTDNMHVQLEENDADVMDEDSRQEEEVSCQSLECNDEVDSHQVTFEETEKECDMAAHQNEETEFVATEEDNEQNVSTDDQLNLEDNDNKQVVTMANDQDCETDAAIEAEENDFEEADEDNEQQDPPMDEGSNQSNPEATNEMEENYFDGGDEDNEQQDPHIEEEVNQPYPECADNAACQVPLEENEQDCGNETTNEVKENDDEPNLEPEYNNNSTSRRVVFAGNDQNSDIEAPNEAEDYEPSHDTGTRQVIFNENEEDSKDEAAEQAVEDESTVAFENSEQEDDHPVAEDKDAVESSFVVMDEASNSAESTDGTAGNDSSVNCTNEGQTAEKDLTKCSVMLDKLDPSSQSKSVDSSSDDEDNMSLASLMREKRMVAMDNIAHDDSSNDRLIQSVHEQLESLAESIGSPDDVEVAESGDTDMEIVDEVDDQS